MSKAKLTPDLQYMCKAMGTKLPILPVHGSAENRCFACLVVELPIPLNFDQMALAWCELVDGVSIFPKLPVYLRVHHAKWLRNMRIRDSLERMQLPLDRLRARLAADQPPLANATAAPATTTAATASATATAAPSTGAPATAAPVNTATPGAKTTVVATRVARLPQVMPKALVSAVAVAAVADDGGSQVVGGVRIGPTPVAECHMQRKRGRDGPTVKRVRTCKRCKAHGDLEQGQRCMGRTKKGEQACEFFVLGWEWEEMGRGSVLRNESIVAFFCIRTHRPLARLLHPVWNFRIPFWYRILG